MREKPWLDPSRLRSVQGSRARAKAFGLGPGNTQSHESKERCPVLMPGSLLTRSKRVSMMDRTTSPVGHRPGGQTKCVSQNEFQGPVVPKQLLLAKHCWYLPASGELGRESPVASGFGRSGRTLVWFLPALGYLIPV